MPELMHQPISPEPRVRAFRNRRAGETMERFADALQVAQSRSDGNARRQRPRIMIAASALAVAIEYCIVGSQHGTENYIVAFVYSGSFDQIVSACQIKSEPRFGQP